jgi:hypothetical protein
MMGSGRGRAKRQFVSVDDGPDPALAAFMVAPDSMPPLGGESQQSIIRIDSQGLVSSEPGPGAQRDALAKAEKSSLVADARANLAIAEAELKRADAAVDAARAIQAARGRELNGARQLLYDLTGGY